MARRLDMPARRISPPIRSAALRQARTRRRRRGIGRAIIAEVRARGDAALIELSNKFDRAALTVRRCADRKRDRRGRSRCDAKSAGRARHGGEAHRELSPPPIAERRILHRRTGADAGLALDAARQRGALCARRHGELSEFGADERGAGARRRRRAHRHGDAGERRQDQSADARRGKRAGVMRSIASAARRRLRRSPTAPRRSRRSTRSSAPATPMSRPPSAKCSARSASTPSPGRRKSSSSPTTAQQSRLDRGRSC
jgi:hypothetical protein